jgi:hypothetical protein
MSAKPYFTFSRLPVLCAAALAFGLLTFGASAPARADVQIGLDLDYALPIDSIGDGGGGFALRFGQQLHLPFLVITPEVAFAYHSYSGDGDPATYRGVGGVRVGIGEIFRLGPFAHLGVGHLDLDFASDRAYTGFTYDVGAFFDLTLIPFLNIGVHGAYNQIAFSDDSDEPTFKWLTFGVHGELIF